MTRILLLGAQGQLGWYLTQTLAPLGKVNALDRRALDLANLDAVRSTVRSTGADILVNAAAYTRVDRAESEKELAARINGDAPAILAEEAARSGALLVHFSTDYVFDGKSRRPYVEDDAPAPLNVYGATKLAGDEAVLASSAEAFVFRVGWLYSRRGQNFLRTIQQLAQERDELRVVDDQHGAPTWARTIAEAVVPVVARWVASRRGEATELSRGLYHMASPDHATWHEFATAIVAQTKLPRGKSRPTVVAIATEDYKTSARRPAWSVLDSEKLRQNFGVALPPWRSQLAACLESLS